MNISVIIPNYNNEKYIEKCIVSVINQTRKPQEIIVVDDLSTDSSRQIIDKLAAEYSIITPVYLHENGGVSHARNVGLNKAKTDYVTTLDGDDFYFNCDKLANEMKLVEQKYEKTGKKIVSYSIIQRVNERGDSLGKSSVPLYEYRQGFIHKYLVSGLCDRTLPRDYCFPREAFESGIKYNEMSNLYEDLEIMLDISLKYPFYFTGDSGTGYRIKDTGLHARDHHTLKVTRERVFNESKKKATFLSRVEIAILSMIRIEGQKIIRAIKQIKARHA